MCRSRRTPARPGRCSPAECAEQAQELLTQWWLPTLPHPITTMDSPYPPPYPRTALNCPHASRSSCSVFSRNLFSPPVQKSKMCRTVHPNEKLAETNLESDSVLPPPPRPARPVTSLLDQNREIQRICLSML